jgi:hypothetical protein
MKRYIWLLTLALPIVSIAQAAKLSMPDFRDLEAKADESVNITLEGEMLKSASGFMGVGRGDPARAAEIAEILKELQGIYVRVFEFDKANMYSARDIEPVLRQAQAPGWKSIMSIRDDEDRVEMWMHEGSANGGMLLVSTEPDELVIVNIVGNIDLEKLSKLQGRMGVPVLPGIVGPMPRAAPAPPAPPAAP